MSARLAVSGSDELARLGQDINRMLNALEESQVALHGNDNRLRAVVKAAPIMLWSVDSKSIVTLLEGKNLDLLGLSPSDSIGKPMSEVYRNIPHLIQEVRQALISCRLALAEFRKSHFTLAVTHIVKPAIRIGDHAPIGTGGTDLSSSLPKHLEETLHPSHRKEKMEEFREYFRSLLGSPH